MQKGLGHDSLCYLQLVVSAAFFCDPKCLIKVHVPEENCRHFRHSHNVLATAKKETADKICPFVTWVKDWQNRINLFLFRPSSANFGGWAWNSLLWIFPRQENYSAFFVLKHIFAQGNFFSGASTQATRAVPEIHSSWSSTLSSTVSQSAFSDHLCRPPCFVPFIELTTSKFARNDDLFSYLT